MIQHQRHNANQLYTQTQLAASASVRKQWVIFEQWFSGQREAIEKEKTVALKDIDRKSMPKKEKDSKKAKLNEDYSSRLGQLACDEWERRLTQTGHSPDEWVDLTVNEAMRIERILGGPLAHLSDEEYAAQWVTQQPEQAQPTPPSVSQSKFAPPPVSATSSISATSSMQSQSTSYEFFSPVGYGDADDEREAGSSSLELLTALTLGSEYITSDEDADLDTQAYFAWSSSNAGQRSIAHPTSRPYTAATVDAKPTPELRNAKKSQAIAMQPSDTPPAPAKSTTSSLPFPSAPSTKPPVVSKSTSSGPGASQRELKAKGKGRANPDPPKEDTVDARHDWFIDKVPKSSAGQQTADEAMALARVPTNNSENQPRVPGYIGPHQHTDPSETTKEEAEFERFKMSVREEKIVEFHKEAAEADINLARDIHHTRNHWGLTPQEEAKKIAEHTEKMIQLRKSKEAERKKIVEEERALRRATFKQRAQDKSSSASVISPTPSVATSSKPLRQRASAQSTASAQPPKVLSPNTTGASTPPKSNNTPPQAAADSLPADLAQRFAESQRLAQLSHSGPSPFDNDMARRFQESQKLAQFSGPSPKIANEPTPISRRPSEDPAISQGFDARPPTRSGFRTVRRDSRVSPPIQQDTLWGRAASSLAKQPPTAPSRKVMMEEVEDDDDYGPSLSGQRYFQPSYPQSSQDTSSSIDRLKSQSDFPLVYEVATPSVREQAAKPNPFSNIVPTTSFQEDEEHGSLPGAWDPNDMESPAYWDALLNAENHHDLANALANPSGPHQVTGFPAVGKAPASGGGSQGFGSLWSTSSSILSAIKFSSDDDAEQSKPLTPTSTTPSVKNNTSATAASLPLPSKATATDSPKNVPAAAPGNNTTGKPAKRAKGGKRK